MASPDNDDDDVMAKSSKNTKQQQLQPMAHYQDYANTNKRATSRTSPGNSKKSSLTTQEDVVDDDTGSSLIMMDVMPKSTKQLMPIAQYHDDNANDDGTHNTTLMMMDVPKSTKQLMPIAQYHHDNTNDDETYNTLATMMNAPKSTKQLMPIAQYHDHTNNYGTSPKRAKRATPGNATTMTDDERQPDHPSSVLSSSLNDKEQSSMYESESMPEPCPQPSSSSSSTTALGRRSTVTKKDGSSSRRRSTSTRRPERRDTQKKSTIKPDDSNSLKSPISPRRRSGLSRKTRIKPHTHNHTPNKEDSQTSGEPTDETTKSHKLMMDNDEESSSCNNNAISCNHHRGPKSHIPRLQKPGEKEKAQERKQAVNKGLDKFLQMVADNAPVSKIKDENRSVYSAIPEMERMRKMAKKQREKRESSRRHRDLDPNNLIETFDNDDDDDNDNDMNMSCGSMPAGNTSSASSGMDHRPVVSLSKTYFSKKLRKLDLTFWKHYWHVNVIIVIVIVIVIEAY